MTPSAGDLVLARVDLLGHHQGLLARHLAAVAGGVGIGDVVGGDTEGVLGDLEAREGAR